MPNIKIVTQEKTDSKTNFLYLFFVYSQKHHFCAHLYEHLVSRSIGNKYQINGGLSSGVLKIKINGRLKLDLLSSACLLKEVTVKDIEKEKKRIILETRSSLNNHKFLIHNLIQYQQKDKTSLLNYLNFLEKNSCFKKEEIFSNLRLDHIIIQASHSITEKYKEDIDNARKKFTLSETKNENSSIEEGYCNKNKKQKFIYINHSVIVPTHSVMEAYKLVIMSRILKDEIEKELIKKGIAYSCQLEINKDFTNRIFSNFSSLVFSKDCEKFLSTVKTIIKTPPINKQVFKINKEKLLEELNQKQQNIILRLEDEIIQKLEWKTKKPLLIEKRIKLIKNMDVQNLYNWWQKKITITSPLTLSY